MIPTCLRIHAHGRNLGADGSSALFNRSACSAFPGKPAKSRSQAALRRAPDVITNDDSSVDVLTDRRISAGEGAEYGGLRRNR
jgi:hypothetical protein